jgi:hypothetical protein
VWVGDPFASLPQKLARMGGEGEAGGGGDSNTARTLPSLPLGYNLQAAHKYAKQHVGPTDTQETPPSLRLWAEKLDLKVEFRYPE